MTAAVLLVAWLGLAQPSSGVLPADWLIVRGTEELSPEFSYESIGAAYFPGQEVRIVGAKLCDSDPAASRLVVGVPSQNAAVAKLARPLGLELEPGQATFRGRQYGPGTGFLLVANDPDGGGLLVLATGVDPAGVLACFSVPASLSRPGFTVVRGRTRLATGPLWPLDGREQIVVVRLDRDLERLASACADWPRSARALRALRALRGYEYVWQALDGPHTVLHVHVRAELDDPEGQVAAVRRAFSGRDLTREIEAAYQRCCQALDRPEGPAPRVYVLADPLAKTNGKSFGPDPVDGRPQIVLNLVPLARSDDFGTVVLHECLHTFQSFGGSRAWDRAVREGVVTLATQWLDPELGDAEALLWSESELAAAEAHREAIVEAFGAIAESADPPVLSAWFDLDGGPREVPGAPPRSGYWVGWLAARAWHEAHPSASLSDLFAASANDLRTALEPR